MADKSFVVHQTEQARDVTLLKSHKTIEVLSIDDADTITVEDYTTVDNAKVINLADGLDVGVTLATNVITINEAALSGAHVIAIVVGS